MNTYRWISVAAFGLALAACSTTKESQTASGDTGRQEKAAVAAADDERREARPDPQDEAQASAAATGDVPASAGSEVAGRVALVDEENREIAIDAGGVTTQVKVAEGAQILVNGERSTLGELKQGQEVRASLGQGVDGPEATRIEVTSKNR